MMNMRIRKGLLAAAMAGLLAAGAASGAAAQSAGDAIVGARIYADPQAEPLDDGVLLIRDGRIEAVGARADVAVPEGYAVHDRTGTVITAGFWNSHVHLIHPGILTPGGLDDAGLQTALTDMFSQWGFTTILDLASTMDTALAVRDRVESGAVAGPRILTVGAPFYPDEGTPIYVRDLYAQLGLPSAEVATISEGVARVNAQADAGASGVKLFVGAIVGPSDVLLMSEDVIRALSDAAHARGQVVFAHPTTVEGVRRAAENGVDVLAHTAPSLEPWPEGFAGELAAHDVGLIPTLLLFGSYAGADTPVSASQAQVRALLEAGGDILFGTDAGFMESYDTTGEFTLMAEVMDWRQILQSLTAAPAGRFNEADSRGRLAPGYHADLVILEADPATDPTAFARVRETWRAGSPIYVSTAGADAHAH